MKYFLLLFLSYQVNVLGQETQFFQYQQGKEYNPKESLEYQKVIGLINEEIITYCNDVFFLSNYYVGTFDKRTLEQKSLVKIKLSYENKPLEFHDIFIFNDSIRFITSYINQSKSKKYFFIQTLLEKGTLSKPKVIGDIQWSSIPGFFSDGTPMKGRSLNCIKFCMNDEKSRIAIVYPNTIFSDGKAELKWNAVQFGSDLSEICRYSFTPSSNSLFLNRIELASNGIIYGHSIENPKYDPRLTSISPMNRSEINSFFGTDNFLEIFDCLNKNNSQVKLPDIGENSFVKMKTNLDKVYFTGLISLDGNVITNSLSQCFDTEGEEVFHSINSVPDGFFKIDREKDKTDAKYFQLSNKYEIQGPFILEDGSFFTIAEEFNYYSNTMNGISTTTVSFNDLVIQYYSNSGVLIWSKKYKKINRDASGFLVSYFPIVQNNNLQILTNRYFSDVEEFSRPETNLENSKIKNCVTIVTIIPDGEIKTEVVLKNQIKNVSPSFRFGYYDNDGSFYSLSRDEGFFLKIFFTKLTIK